MNTVKVVSDVICPWCWIGKRRLEAALRELRSPVAVSWHPFQLNPDLPVEGLDRKTYRIEKFGSWERSLALDAQIREVGTTVGLKFHHDLQANTPNTFNAHRVIWLAGQLGVQDAVVEALFRAYFRDGVNLSIPENLAQVTASVGLDRVRVQHLLATDEGAAEVQAEEQAFKALGISGVPFFILNDRLAVSGAQTPEILLEAFALGAALKIGPKTAL